MDFSAKIQHPVVLTGIWDLESGGSEYMTDNSGSYKFKLYGRHVDPAPDLVGEFCEGKATGSYMTAQMVSVDCENDSFGGRWTKIFQVNQPEKVFGDTGVVSGDLPLWYRTADGAPFDEYLWVDEGTTTDFAEGNADWDTQGYDAGKHYFFASDGSNWKIKDKGNGGWAFSD